MAREIQLHVEELEERIAPEMFQITLLRTGDVVARPDVNVNAANSPAVGTHGQGVRIEVL